MMMVKTSPQSSGAGRIILGKKGEMSPYAALQLQGIALNQVVVFIENIINELFQDQQGILCIENPCG